MEGAAADISTISGANGAHFGARRPGAADTLHGVKTLRQSALLLACAAGPAAAQGLPADALAQAATLAREAAGRLAPAGARVEAAAGTPDPRLRLAPCTTVEAFLPAGMRAWGRTRVGLRCKEGAVWSVTVPVTVKVFARAAVAAQALPAGTVLDDTLLKTAEIDWAAMPAPVQPQVDALRGRALARPLAAGDAVTAADLRVRQYFVAGETVRLVAQGPGFAISSEAQALTPGLEGQPARARTEGGRIVTGMPDGERRMAVAP